MRLKANTAAALVYRATQALVWAFFVRLVLIHYGAPAYGMLALLLSVIAWLQLCDFGIIAYLRTAFARLRAQGANESVSVSLLRAAVVRTSFGFALILGLVSVAGIVAPRMMAGLDGRLHFAEVHTRVSSLGYVNLLIVYGYFLILTQFLVAYFAASYQQYRFYLLASLGVLLQFLASWILILLSGDLFYSFATFLLASLLPQIFVLVLVAYGRKSTHEHPPIRSELSTMYFLSQLGGMVCYNIDVLMVSLYFDLRATAIYGTLKNIAQIFISVHALFMQQAWAGLSQAYDLCDREGFIAIIRRCEIITFGAIPIVIIFFTVAMPPLFVMWTAGRLGPIDHGIAFAFASFSALFMAGSLYGTVALAIAKVRGVVFLAWAAASMSVCFAWEFHNVLHLYAVIMGLCIAATTGFVGCLGIVRVEMRDLRNV